MAQQTIGVGTEANDGTGDTPRTTGQKMNANFAELYASIASLTSSVAGKASSSHTQAASTISDSTIPGRALLTAADVAAQRTALGLGTSSVLDVGSSANQVVQLNSSAQLPAVDGSLLTGLITRAFSTSKAGLASLTGLSNLTPVDLLGYDSASDGGGQPLTYYSTGRSGITVDNGFYFAGPGADDYFGADDKSVIVARRFGVKADGVTNDYTAMTKVIAATQLGYGSVVEMPVNGDIRMGTQVVQSVTKDIIINGNNCTINKDRGAFQFNCPIATLVLAADVAYKSTTITVSDASTVSPGDIITLYGTSTANARPESGWNYQAFDTRKVMKVVGNVIHFDREANLLYIVATDEVLVWHFVAPRVYIENLHFAVVDDAGTGSGDAFIRIQGCTGRFNRLSFYGDRTDQLRPIDMLGCVDFVVEDCRFERGHYGLSIEYSRNILVKNIVGVNYVAHVVVPASWSSDITIDGMVLNNCDAGIDSHPCIRVTYRNVKQTNATSPNVRAVGVTIENCEFIRRENITDSQMYFAIGLGYTSINPKYGHLLTDYDIHLENVTWLPPGYAPVDNSAQMTMSCRRMTVKNCQLSGLMIEGHVTEGITITGSRLGYLSHRFEHPLTVTDTDFDWNLNKYNNDIMRLHTQATIRLSGLRCVNYPEATATLAGYCSINDLTAVNCNFGKLLDFASNKTGTPQGYLFTNCKMELKNDAVVGFDTSKFVNCTGSIGGIPLQEIPNKFARFDGTDDFATILDYTYPAAAGTAMARVRVNPTMTLGGPFSCDYSQPFYYIHSSGNCWCAELRTSWVANFTLNSSINKTDWHWVVIRTDSTDGWEFLQATDTGSLSSRATAAHESFNATSSYGVIGKDRSGGNFWRGDIDRFLVFPTRLTNAQIQAVIAGGVGYAPLLRYEFSKIVSGTFIDEASTSRVATTSGGPIILEGDLYVSKSAAYTLLGTDSTVNCIANTFALTLPDAIVREGKIYTLKNSGAGTITINTSYAQTIDGGASGSITLAQYEFIIVQSNGSDWITIGVNP